MHAAECGTPKKKDKGSERMRVHPKMFNIAILLVPHAGPMRETDCSGESQELVPRAYNISSNHSVRKMNTKAPNDSQMSFSVWTVPPVLV